MSKLTIELINKVAASQDDYERAAELHRAIGDFHERVAADPELKDLTNRAGYGYLAPFIGAGAGYLTGKAMHGVVNYLGRDANPLEKAIVENGMKHVTPLSVIGGGLGGLAVAINNANDLRNHPAYQETLGRYD